MTQENTKSLDISFDSCYGRGEIKETLLSQLKLFLLNQKVVKMLDYVAQKLLEY